MLRPAAAPFLRGLCACLGQPLHTAGIAIGVRALGTASHAPGVMQAKGTKAMSNDAASVIGQDGVIVEGRAEILAEGSTPPSATGSAAGASAGGGSAPSASGPQRSKVFYNKAQVVNRNLSVAVLRVLAARRQSELDAGAKHMRNRLSMQWRKDGLDRDAIKERREAAKAAAKPIEAPGLAILEAMSATGLRSLRYALEIPHVDRVVANDIDPAAVEDIRRNVAHNVAKAKARGGEAGDVDAAAVARVDPRGDDARWVMLSHPETFDVIDLDPYGSPAALMDTAIQSVTDGGMLCITATDMAVLCGKDGEVCFGKYGAYPFNRFKGCHEMALRILLGFIERNAAKYKRYIVPVLSVSIDFYVRVFVRVFTSALQSKSVAARQSYVYKWYVRNDRQCVSPAGPKPARHSDSN